MKYISGQYYHIYNRGVEKRDIFACEENYRFLLRRIQEFLPNYPVAFIAYCLMSNHYHFLARAEADGSVGPFLQWLFNSYTQAFNQQEKRTGTLFEGRAKSVLIDSASYLFHIVRYIHLNPVRAGLTQRPEDWPYSNYLEFIGAAKGLCVRLHSCRNNLGRHWNILSSWKWQFPMKSTADLKSISLIEA